MESSTATEAATVWEPNQELLDMLVGMGISKITAEHALYYTGNQSAEAAASYVFDNPDIEEMPPMFKVKSRSKHKDQEKLENEAGSSSEEEAESTEKYKMVFVVNTALNMGVGKIASQVAHACLGLYRLLTEYEYMGDVADNWERDGAKKVVLRGKNELHLDELETQARAKQLFTYLLHDAGRTQIPANSVTVLAVFGPCQRVDKVTGELSLL